jgi:hypothetical protein
MKHVATASGDWMLRKILIDHLDEESCAQSLYFIQLLLICFICFGISSFQPHSTNSGEYFSTMLICSDEIFFQEMTCGDQAVCSRENSVRSKQERNVMVVGGDNAC